MEPFCVFFVQLFFHILKQVPCYFYLLNSVCVLLWSSRKVLSTTRLYPTVYQSEDEMMMAEFSFLVNCFKFEFLPKFSKSLAPLDWTASVCLHRFPKPSCLSADLLWTDCFIPGGLKFTFHAIICNQNVLKQCPHWLNWVNFCQH